ncbi:MAG: hypothetical protein LBC73_00715 [Oscillospiraceae bacterium]|jgi:hypothetical protein|nr:hypothetical protein [Oscillospiraceae bacterium]
MKKRLLPIVLAMLMLLTLIPFGPSALASEEYTAWFGAQMDPVNGWDLGDEGMTTFRLNEPATISIDFGEVVSFGDGNYVAIETNVPNPFDGMDAFPDPVLAEVLSLKLDGNEVEMGDVFLNAEGKDAIDGSGPGLRLTLANFWSAIPDDLMPITPATLGEFETLEVTFIVRGVYLARLGAQMDPVNGWDLGAKGSTGFVLGTPAVIEIDFEEDVSFGDGNYIAIETNLPNPFEDVTIFSDPDMAQILSFTLDGNEVSMGDVLINAEGMDSINGSGPGLRLTITNKWNGDISEQPLDPEDLGEFQKLRIEFIINYVGEPPEPPPADTPDLIMSGKAYIGGVFVFLDRPHPGNEESPDISDWWAFEDQAVNFDVGVPFTVGIDMGDEKIRHDLAHWDGEAYIIAVDTDVAMNPNFYDAHIYWITKDGANVSFEADYVHVGQERGNLRVSITNSWAESAGEEVPIAGGPQRIGEFSKLEIRMVFLEKDAPVPADGVEPDTPAPAPDVPDTPRPSDDRDKDSDFPKWLVPVIIAGAAVIIIAVVVVVIIKKKKS